jgi:hypothetical protein
MKTPFRYLTIATLCLALAFFSWPGAEAGGPGIEKEPVLPDKAFLEIVKEANRFIQEPLARDRPDAPVRGETAVGTFRANALLIALAAQNRMGRADADAGQLATLRDAALKLAEAVEKQPCDLAEVRKQAEILNQYPNLKADPNARPGLVRLKDRFDHGPISFLFGGCSGGKGHAIQLQISKLAGQQAPFTPDQAEKLELLAYKVALIGELLRDLDDVIPAKNPELRKEWVSLAGEAQTTGWQLAETARGQNSTDMRRGVSKLHGVCTSCHEKFF